MINYNCPKNHLDDSLVMELLFISRTRPKAAVADFYDHKSVDVKTYVFGERAAYPPIWQ